METPQVRIPPLAQAVLDTIPRKELDIPYADGSPSQRLDIYWPARGEGPFPVVAHFHGGAFMFGTRRDVNLAPMLRVLAHGYALVSVGYRLSGEARFPALVYDAKAALRFLRANAARYRLRGDQVAAWGPSAGGYLAAMLGATGGNPAFEDVTMGNAGESSAVQAVVDWCGPAGDFCRMDVQIRESGIGEADHDDPLSPESQLLGCAIQQVPELSRLAAPVTHVRADIPPFLIHHGEADGTVPVQQSIDLARRIEAVAGAGRVTLRTFAGKGHHGEPWYEAPALTEEVVRFLDGVFDGG